MKFNNFHAKRAEELVRRPAHTPYFSAQRKDFVQILKDLDKIGCTSAIQASLIAFGLHYLSRSKSDPKHKRAAGARPDNFSAQRE